MKDLPAGWKDAALGDVCCIVGGGTPKTDVPAFWGGEIAWITPADMSADRSQTLVGGARSLTEAGYNASGAKLVPPGSVVVSSRAPIGYVTIAGAELSTNQGCKTAIPPAGIHSKYLYWFLIAAKQDLEARASGTTFKEISAKAFGATRFWWPSLDEQERIVEVLEDHISQLDAAETYLRSALIRLEAYRSAQLEELPPADAPRIALGLLATASGYGTSAKCVADGAGVPVVRIPNLRGGVIDLADEKRIEDPRTNVESLMLAEGDLLIVRTNGSRSLIGRSAVVPEGLTASFASYLIRYVLDPARVDPEWVHLMLERPNARRVLEGMASSSAGQHNLGLKKLDRVKIPVPPLELQRELRLDQHDVAKERMRLKDAIHLQQTRAASLRRSLLAAAFSGQLTGSLS